MRLAGVEKGVLLALVLKKRKEKSCFYNVPLVTRQQERLVYEHVIGGGGTYQYLDLQTDGLVQ